MVWGIGIFKNIWMWIFPQQEFFLFNHLILHLELYFFFKLCDVGDSLSSESGSAPAIFELYAADRDGVSVKHTSPLFCLSWENLCKIHHRQTDRQILWHYIQVCVDFFFKLNLLPAYSLRLQGEKLYLYLFFQICVTLSIFCWLLWPALTMYIYVVASLKRSENTLTWWVKFLG